MAILIHDAHMVDAGTSACWNGVFFCRNLGSEPRHLNASFVDDGICDCCDGSDEINIKCHNSCVDDAKESIQLLKNKLHEAEQGLSKRMKYIRYVESLFQRNVLSL